jgi:hypothetical protein
MLVDFRTRILNRSQDLSHVFLWHNVRIWTGFLALVEKIRDSDFQKICQENWRIFRSACQIISWIDLGWRELEQLSVPKEKIADVLLTELRNRICATLDGFLAELTHLFMSHGSKWFDQHLWISPDFPLLLARFSSFDCPCISIAYWRETESGFSWLSAPKLCNRRWCTNSLRLTAHFGPIRSQLSIYLHERYSPPSSMPSGHSWIHSSCTFGQCPILRSTSPSSIADRSASGSSEKEPPNMFFRAPNSQKLQGARHELSGG